MIDPLLPGGQTRRAEPAENWSEDPWDRPDVAARSGRLGSAALPPDHQEWWPHLKRVVVVAVAVSLLFGSAGLWYLGQVNPAGGDEVATNFTINDGDTLESIAQRLKDDDFISNAAIFRWYVGRNGGLEVIPGYYQVVKGSHMGDIMARLGTPPAATFVNVTFPEGFTVDQMGARLAERTLRLNAETFVAAANSSTIETWLRPTAEGSLEGLLFPDTYQVSGEESESQVVSRMVSLMERVGRQEGLDESDDLVGYSPYQVLIVASMIEREAKVAEDRAKIARVIYNRLDLRMPLQIDATLYYGAPAGAEFSVLKEADTPYNTYKRRGLPPTPIASPGRASIVAALNPAPNPNAADEICRGVTPPCRYLYYVLANAEGGHEFAATLKQHERNVDEARQAGILP
ncbi:MAG: endolytic transglycosylase MltG [Ilumatobacteraceae bacterium]